MRDRLSELIGCAVREYSEYTTEMFNAGNYGMESLEEYVSDYLIKRGVTVPPCKVGDTVYALWEVPTEIKYVIYCAEVKEIRMCKRNNRIVTIYKLEPIEYRGRMREYYDFEFGELVFLTKEDAEQALKGGAE